ncbi:MAG TPA: hypothetical protein VKB49_11005 [Candidatus Sulfotelmatobacter sp.]|nr:hypothetical protein [Candidatus Sulfotelmatobacter sp.]
MKIIKIIVGLVVFAFVMSTGWQLAACEFANYQLRDDLRDVATMGSSRLGVLAESSDGDLREAVIRRAGQHGIHLVADQILVQRSGTTEHPVIFLAAKYRARVVMPGFSLIFHLKATSG